MRCLRFLRGPWCLSSLNCGESKLQVGTISGFRSFSSTRILSDDNKDSINSREQIQPELPDYNTSINIHEHKLQRPTRPPPKLPRWEGLQDLSERTKGSLIPETLKQMENDEDFQITAKQLKEMGQKKLTREERKRRQRALDKLGVPDFIQFLNNKKSEHGITDKQKHLKKKSIEVFQLNIGIYCNQACNHCHVESSPKRQEMMSHEVARKCIDILKNSPSVHTMDVTGGAPELCNEFRYIATEGRKLGIDVIDRCNLTALLEPGQEDTAQFLADNKIHIIASLPCYTAKNVNLQRGKGVFDKSIQSLLNLNSLGYGFTETGLQLDLVYNPLGAFLPPEQKKLEEQYRKELWDVFGIEFNKLFTMTNMPIKRFADFLYRRNELNDYMDLLVRNYNLNTVGKLMCLDTLNVSWDGSLYDCDFNQQLDLGIPKSSGTGTKTVFDIHSVDDMAQSDILVDNHCYGCTAGMGSS